jgi:Tol biopolymer transport system component/DNA-binding winged helix-turn-helix (wHTH) protein
MVGDWTVEPELNALSKANITVHLEPKVMKVLLHLAAHHGEVLSKEELIEAVWPDAFVTDDALTRCISLLRRQMEDDSHTPRYIQTIPKVGYRLVAGVHPLIEQPTIEPHPSSFSAPPIAVDGLVPPPAEPAPTPKPGAMQALAKRLLRWQILAGAAMLASAIAGFALWRTHHRPARPSFRVTSLTSYSGLQDQPSFSPDGTRVAFVWDNMDNGGHHVFIKQIGSETLLRLTSGNESNFSPVWSADGTRIAYLSASWKGMGIYVISSMGGAAQQIYSPMGMVHWEQGALSWSPDGKSLVFPDAMAAHNPSSIYLLSLDTFQARAISSPPSAWEGDLAPVFSPDGRKIAFVRAIESAVRDIFVMNADGTKPSQITFDGRIVDSLTWTPDSDSIVFSSDRGGKFALWMVPAGGGDPERLPVGTANSFRPAISNIGHRLLYTESSSTWSILGVQLRSGGKAPGKPVAIVSSTEQDSAPSFAPDGTQFAFQSWRSGTQELWVSSRDGLSLRQLTSGGRRMTGSPSFSPDGQNVAFDGRPAGHSHIFVVPASGGSPREITAGDSNDILPRWSADGQFVYFASNRSGAWQAWKISARGGQPQQVTTNGAFVALESPDGRWVYYTKSDLDGIWRIPAAGGPEERILAQPRAGFWGYWCVAARGIYLLESDQAKPRIMLYDPQTKKSTRVATLDRHPPPYSGLTVNRSEDEFLITDEHNAGSHITLVENFP